MDSRFMLRALRAALLLALILFCASPLSAQPVVAGWPTHGGNAQHTGVSQTAAQSLKIIHWSTPVDEAPPTGGILIHYGSPIVTAANTVIIPVKTAGGYKVEARWSKNGSLTWSATTDYILPPHNWTPSYSPALTPGNRLYFPGAGGTVYFRDAPDGSVPTASGQLAFYGLSSYQANPSSFASSVFVNTPITSDAAGNIYFGFRTSGSAPLNLQSGIARIDTAGNGSWISASAAANDASITVVPHQAAPVLSNDGQTLYVVVAGPTNGYLIGLDPTTLQRKNVAPGAPMRVALKDPRNGGSSNAQTFDDSSASPMVGPDGDVYYGVMGRPFNGSRGWLLHFSADLTQTKTPGAFGWDNTASVVPASVVPSYTGSSSYLIFSKYNDYAGADGGAGVNKIAVLDPNATQVEPHASSGGLLVMKEILTISGPTPDLDNIAQFPNAVREWCINAAAVDPITASVMVNSEDGKLYRWDLASNTLSQAVTLSSGIVEAYTPTVIGPDGTVYAINRAVLSAVGRRPKVGIGNASTSEGGNAVFPVTLNFASTEVVTVDYATANGSALADSDYVAAAGTLVFAPGETAKTVSVQVKADTSIEGDEAFFVDLENPVNATIAAARRQGRATIIDNGALPALSIDDVSVSEGDSGTRNAVFTVTLSPSSQQTVTVAFATADGSATVASGDYQSASGTLTFSPGQTTKTITVVVGSDTLNEGYDTFVVNLSAPVNATLVRDQGVGAIMNDDAMPTLSIGDVSLAEGDGGVQSAVFTVTLSPASGRPVKVDYATADGTATVAGSDYLPQSGTLTFGPGETQKTIAIDVVGDTVKESSEAFFVDLSFPRRATLTRAQGRCTLTNDDKN
jgi:hypothetical protein